MMFLTIATLLIPLSFVKMSSGDQNAYLAFKLKNAKLSGQVEALQNRAREIMKFYVNLGEGNRSVEVESAFVDSQQLEIRLIDFFYDETEHKERIPGILADASVALCSLFPRHITFNRFDMFYIDKGSVSGVAQELEIRFKLMSLASALDSHGIVYSPPMIHNLDPKHARFPAIRYNDEMHRQDERRKIKTAPRSYSISTVARDLLGQPLRASAFVDTIYFCVENDDQSCEEVGSHKIEKC